MKKLLILLKLVLTIIVLLVFVERLIQMIRNRLACIIEEKSFNNAFLVKHAIKIIIHQLRISKQKTTKISPFEMHFGRRSNTPLSAISTKPILSWLSYKNIINHYLDEDPLTPEDILADDKCFNAYRSDIGVEIGIIWATRYASERERESTDEETDFSVLLSAAQFHLQRKQCSSNWLERSTVNEDLKTIWRVCVKSQLPDQTS